VLPNTGLKNTVEIAERIRTTIERFDPPFKLPDMLPRVTVSIGAAIYPVDANSADQLIKKADEMLYLAKRNGKNQVKYMAAV
jgi:diguanylate cyclase (GGDEF)-like protein